MAEYIERESLLEDIQAAVENEGMGSMVAGALKRYVKRVTAADVAPVVRCRDCIRRYDTDECPMCFLIEGNYCEYTNENGFCDRGERKEGAE